MPPIKPNSLPLESELQRPKQTAHFDLEFYLMKKSVVESEAAMSASL